MLHFRTPNKIIIIVNKSNKRKHALDTQEACFTVTELVIGGEEA